MNKKLGTSSFSGHFYASQQRAIRLTYNPSSSIFWTWQGHNSPSYSTVTIIKEKFVLSRRFLDKIIDVFLICVINWPFRERVVHYFKLVRFVSFAIIFFFLTFAFLNPGLCGWWLLVCFFSFFSDILFLTGTLGFFFLPWLLAVIASFRFSSRNCIKDSLTRPLSTGR